MKLRSTWCAIFLLTVPVLAATPPQKPGRWQVSIKIEMPGMPFQMPAITTETCVTEEDLATPEKTVPIDRKSDCKVSDYAIDGNTVTYKMTCPKQKMKGEGRIAYTEDSFDGVVNLDMDGTEMKQTLSGKLLAAECSKKK